MRDRGVTKISFNGTTYDSVDQMPPDVRAQFQRAMSMLADKDGNGVPDILEGRLPEPTDAGAFTVETKTTQEYVVNGRRYDRLEDLPPAIRAALNSPNTPASSAGYGRMQVNVSLSTLLAVLTVAVIALLLLAWLW